MRQNNKFGVQLVYLIPLILYHSIFLSEDKMKVKYFVVNRDYINLVCNTSKINNSWDCNIIMTKITYKVYEILRVCFNR